MADKKVTSEVDKPIKNLGGRPTKYSAPWCLAELKEMLQYLLDNKDCYLNSEFLEKKNYTQSNLNYWIRKFTDKESKHYNKDITDTIDKIREVEIIRIQSGALKKKIDPNFARYLLSTRYGIYDIERKETVETKITLISESKQQLLDNLSKQLRLSAPDIIEGKIIDNE